MKSSPKFIANPNEVALFSYIWGTSLAKSLTIEEQNLLGNIFFLAGQTLFTIASVQTLQNIQQQEKQDTKKETKQNQESTGKKKQKQDTTQEKAEAADSTDEKSSEIEQLKKDIRYLQDQVNKLRHEKNP